MDGGLDETHKYDGQHRSGLNSGSQMADSIFGGDGHSIVVQLISGGVEQTHSSQIVSESNKRSPSFNVKLPNVQTGSASIASVNRSIVLI